ncbi:Uncharacterised protein [Mycobacteroides abscessus]|nr:Uncharacterised protein [Mycobacteroides abscessus]CPU27835.1 Uncharacterised protein [Mycobacteroides abscessus]CPU33493.1 Uncharacterised protein [Mycobacteroides abscessus]CPV34747.1 Uncharacterised protein [Mycobacteroides abscessus]
MHEDTTFYELPIHWQQQIRKARREAASIASNATRPADSCPN